MNKTRMKNVCLTLLVILTLTIATIPITIATVPSLSIAVSPSSCHVPRTVRVYGSWASPCGDVEIWWDEDGDPNVLDVLLGVTEANSHGDYEIYVTIPEAFCGAHDVTAWDKATGHSAGTKFTVKPKIILYPSSGPVGTEVTVEGTGFKSNVQMDIYYDEKVISTTPAKVFTNDVGSFTATFIVPEGVYGEHYVKATDRSVNPCWDDDWFFVEPEIVLDPTQGPPNTEVTIDGTGFDGCENVAISFTCPLGNTWWWYDVVETNEKGSFTYVFTIPSILPLIEDMCCEVCPGPWTIDAETSEAYAEAEFIVTPWFTIDPLKGPVGAEVTASGYGFEVGYVDIIFKAFPSDIIVKEDVPVDEMGNFVTTFNVPEVVEGYYKVSADGIMATWCNEELCFEVLPWIWITPSSGNVGDTVTVIGKGWDSLRHVDIIYAGIANCPDFPLPVEWIVCPHMALWMTWEKTPVCTYNSMIVLQPWGWTLIAEAFTDENGSFELTFEVPESPGGYHPIYAGQCISTGCPSKLSENVPVFRVEPKIWVEGHEGTSEGISGEYVTLYGTGFSYVEFWMSCQSYPERAFCTYFRAGTFVLDFDSNKQWINEFNFIMNNEYSEGWQEMYWVWLKWIMDGCCEPCPLFPEGYLPMYIDLSGTISHGYWWRWLWLLFYHEAYPFSDVFYDDMTYKGCPFLKVPVLEPGEKELLAYYFGLEAHMTLGFEDTELMPLEFVPAGIVEGIPTMFVGSIEDPMSSLFGFKDCEFSVQLGKIYTETASTTFTVKKPQVECNTEEVLKRLNELEAKVTGILKDTEGNILAKIETAVGTVEAKLSDLDARITDVVKDAEGSLLARIETVAGTIDAKLSALDARVTGLVTDTEGHIIAKIETAIGPIQTDISNINAKLLSLDGNVATIGTSLGTFTANLTDINTKITVMNGNIARIETDVGTIKGLVMSIDGNTAEIKTDIGTIKGTLSEVRNNTGLQPATIGLSILAAISAIAAAVMILRKVYLK